VSSERRPLAGARVVITRSAEKAEALLRLLEGLGAEGHPCPVTRICGPAEEEAARLDAAVARLRQGEYDWLLLSSANAVTRLIATVRAAGPAGELLARVRIACVGSATAAALRAHGLEARVVPQESDAAGLGRAVVAAAGDRVRSARVLLPGAAGGRGEAADALRAAGAEVDVVILYRSCTADPGDPAVANGLSLMRNRAADVVAFYAPSQVRATCELLGDDAPGLIGACRVVAAIGQTTKAALAERGIAVHAIPQSPSAEALASAIAIEYAQRFKPAPRADSDER